MDFREEHIQLSSKGAAHNSVATLVGELFGRLFRVGLTFFLISVLTREQFGIMVAIQALVDPLSALAVFGLDVVARRIAPLDERGVAPTVATLRRVRLGISLTLVICVVISAFVFDQQIPGGAWAFIAGGLLLLPTSLNGPLKVALHATHQMDRVVLVPTFAQAFQFAIVLVLWHLDAPIPWFIAALSINEFIFWIFVSRLYKQAHGNASVYDPIIAKRLWFEALPLAYTALVAVAYNRMGYWYIEHFHGVTPLADYGAAVRIAEAILLVATAMASSYAPYVAQLVETQQLDDFVRVNKRIITRSFLILIPLATATSWAAYQIMPSWKPTWTGIASSFLWLAFAASLNFVCQLATASLVALRRNRTLAWIETANLVLFSVLGYWWAPSLGGAGVAMASFFMQCFNVIAQLSLIALSVRERKQGQLHAEHAAVNV